MTPASLSSTILAATSSGEPIKSICVKASTVEVDVVPDPGCAVRNLRPAYLSGNFSLDEAIARAQQATKRYVKRQFTWWKGSNINPNLIFNYFPSNIDLNGLEILKKYTN